MAEGEGGNRAADWALAARHGLANDRVPATAYTSPEVFAAERERIFARAWIPVAREADVAESGDFIRRDIPTLGKDVIITRGKDGALNAFHNACQHRGAPVVAACSGRAARFVCPYHAWSYGIDGKLLGITGREHFPQVDGAVARLRPVHLACWNGFIFLNFADEPGQDLPAFLGEFGQAFAGLPFDDYPHAIELTWEVAANWKLLMEASNEAYHVAYLHGLSLGDMVTTPGNPLNHGHAALFSPPHASATIEANPNYAPDHPVMRFAFGVEAFRGQPGGGQQAGKAARGQASFLAHPAVNRASVPTVSTESMLLFPFTCLQLLANRYIWFQYWPLAADRTRLVLRVYLQSAPASWREAFAAAHTAAYSRDIASEDVGMASAQQRALASGGIGEVMLGENEPVLRFFHAMVARWLDAGAIP